MIKRILSLMLLLAGNSLIAADCNWVCKTYFIDSRYGNCPNQAAETRCQNYCNQHSGNQPTDGPYPADYAYTAPVDYTRPANLPPNTVNNINGATKTADQAWCMTQADCDFIAKALCKTTCHPVAGVGVCY